MGCCVVIGDSDDSKKVTSKINTKSSIFRTADRARRNVV